MKHLIIGMGEIGSAVHRVLLMDLGYEVYNLDINSEPVKDQMDVLHICFPFSEDFVKEVKKYRVKYKPQLVIIYSTVPIGTTKQIPHAVHSPIEGKHPKLYFGVKAFKRWIGYNTKADGKLAQKLWKSVTECKLVADSNYTEFLKLGSTSKYGINIVWADYMADTAEQLDMPYDYVKDWDEDYNALYTRMKLPQFKKYVLDAPDGVIGGHCVRENSFLLDKAFPDDMLKMIYDMEGFDKNEKSS